MNDKKRLIELFKKTDYNIFPDSTVSANLANQFSEYALNDIVDKLLTNGVIIPPCKVGDKVWLIKSLNWQQTEWGIKEGKISMIQQKADKSWKFRVTENHSVQDYTVDSIGKIVFLSEKEAKYALKNRRSVSLVNGHIEE